MSLAWSRRAVMASLVMLALGGCNKEGVFFQSMNPSSGRLSGGEEVRIRGSGFGALGNMEIRIGGRVATNIGIADNETIVLSTPEGRAEDAGRKLDVFILTSEGRSFVFREAFSYRQNPGEGTPGSDLQRRL